MNNNEETTSNKDQEQKIDTPENNGTEPNLENSLEKKIEELNDKLLRSLAENQNLRKIHEKEREDLIKYSSSSFAREILNLADNLERAFGLFKDNPKFKTDEFKDTMIGIELIEKELINSFDKNGIKSFESMGKKFDPKGDYVRKFIPSLIKIPDKFVHSPWEMSLDDQEKHNFILGKDYPLPIVDLSDTRKRALAAFKSISE